jgi:hypothetical protein
MNQGQHLREMWEAGDFLEDYWLPHRRTISDFYLPDPFVLYSLEGKHPVWYVNSLTLAAGATGRMRISVDPGFALTMITGQSSVASPADGLGAAQAQIFDNARRQRFSSRPVVSPLMFGTASDPFILRNPYAWTGTVPVLITLQNRASAQNTIYLVLHGWRDQG